MTLGMTEPLGHKFAVSMPGRLVRRARDAVAAGRAESLSGYIAGAVERRLAADELAAMLDELLADSGGPLTPAETLAADRALGVRPPAVPALRREASRRAPRRSKR